MFSHIAERNTLKTNDGKVWEVKYTGLIVLASLCNCRFTPWMFLCCIAAFLSNLYREVFLLSKTNSLIFN